MGGLRVVVLIVGCVGFIGYTLAAPSFNSRPIIKTGEGKQEIIVDSQTNVTLLCEGKEKITWTYPNNTIEDKYWSTVIVETSESNGKFYAKLNLFNASYVDVDYYYCHADDAPKDDEFRSTKIYVYIRDPEHLSVKPVDPVIFLSVYQNEYVVLPCRPTSPDVTVTLDDSNNDEMHLDYNPFRGYTLQVTSLLYTGYYKCIFQRDDFVEELLISLHVGKRTEYAPKPYIHAPNNGQTKIGDRYELNCSVIVEQNVYFMLNWTVPDQGAVESGRIHATKASASDVNGSRQGLSTLTITKVQANDKGDYICTITDHTQKKENASKTIYVYEEGQTYLTLKEESAMSIINTTAGAQMVQFVVVVESFPKAGITWINNRGEEIEEIIKNTKYTTEVSSTGNKATLKIKDVTLNDSGIYEVRANNGKREERLNFTLIVQDRPAVHIVSPNNYHIIGKNTSIDCKAAGYPIPTVEWFFKPCQNNNCDFKKLPSSLSTHTTEGLQLISTLKMNATKTGIIKCEATNSLDSDSSTEGFFLTDVTDGFNIWSSDNHDEIATGSKVEIYCGVSKYNYTNNITWYYEENSNRYPVVASTKYKIKNFKTDYTYRSTLTIDPINKTDSKVYMCITQNLASELDAPLLLSITVKDPVFPRIFKSNMNDTTIKMKPGHWPFKWQCVATGIPTPSIIWKKDNQDFPKEIHKNHVTLSEDNTILKFSVVHEEDAGTYTCEARNAKGSDSRTMKLEITGQSPQTTLLIISLVLIFGFVILLTILVIRIKKEKKLRRELKIAGLNNFEKGAMESLNPDLGIDEQAELLPYDKKWEFPREKLKLGKQLGSGAFGVVMKAEAFGICEGETVSTVAVKMVKRNADYTFIKALASELKIMVHLGKHLNVVNLLGACTKNVTKRELLVIVEYCRFGNLHNYLLRHRDDFVNQIDPKNGQIDTTIGEELLNRTLSIGSNQSSGRPIPNAGVDYRATPNVSNTTDSTVVCSPTGDDVMILSNNSSIQPEWRSNYRGDYKGHVKPTSTHDLLCWAFQVARGMEYLSSRKVMHGDLAARNILLAEDNIVKICDFGLAKSMYKSDNYKKKGDGPLPVKWMAVESIRDRVFSTQSDVWSFGIVLWEFFSLARTPYPGMDADERLYNKLVDGYRMDQPEYATKEIYQIMLECWHAKPVYRPSFTKLADDLGNMLQEVVRKHYIDLNDPYIMMNNEQLAGRSDYLAMACAPDYGNLASPGHEYVNGKVVIPEDQQGESSGYLPMDIFSPRTNDSVFNFEVGKNKNSNGEPASGVELLPMLHATESDSELSPVLSKSFSNPNYHSAVIHTNDAPKKDSIVSTSDNYINMPQQKSMMNKTSDSFSNPSYIHMDTKNNDENDKNHYINSHSRDWERPLA